ncbi:MAG: hypothetical protein WDZ49_06470 [Litorilinea sp.]
MAGLFTLDTARVQAQAETSGPAPTPTATPFETNGEVEVPVAPAAATQTTTDEEIIYIDASGTIQVIDPFVPAGRIALRWSSPTSGWQDLAAGDVNGDGDMEIIALSDTSGTIRLTVFDPVVASGAISDQGGTLDGVPWDVLYETSFIGANPIMAVGNFDPGINGDEIFIGFRNFNGLFQAIILNANDGSINPTTQRPSGRDWKRHVDKFLDIPFDYAAAGDINVDGRGVDEIVLAEAAGLADAAFRVYEAENDFRFVTRFGRSNSSPLHLAIGNVVPGNSAEVIFSTSASNRNNFFVTERQSNGDMDIDGEDPFGQELLVPPALNIFLADVTGNGDKEVFFLREWNGTDRDRLILRNAWGDDVDDTADFEVALDTDNGYRVGAGGNFDGNSNGREAIAIMRDNRIRLYKEPVRGPRDSNPFDYNVNTNARAIAFANLDAIGYVQGPQIQITPESIGATLEFGVNENIGQINVTNLSPNETIQVSAQAFNTNGTVAGFVSFTPSSANTPANLGVRFNGAGLNSGLYQGYIRITSPNANVVNLPHDIPFSVTVLEPPPPGFNPSTGGTGFFYYRCEDYFATLDDEPEDAQVNDTQSPATLHQPTMPQTVTVRFADTLGSTGSGGTVTMAVIDAPDGAGSAQTGSGAPGYISNYVDAFVDHNGDVVLIDDAGGRTVVEMPSADTAAIDQEMWPSLVPWVTSVQSNRDQIPLTVELVGDLSPVISDMDEPVDYIRRAAMLVVVGDQLYGPPPRNVRVVPLTLVCTNSFLGMPLISDRR